jgi:hypothetical protein
MSNFLLKDIFYGVLESNMRLLRRVLLLVLMNKNKASNNKYNKCDIHL